MNRHSSWCGSSFAAAAYAADVELRNNFWPQYRICL